MGRQPLSSSPSLMLVLVNFSFFHDKGDFLQDGAVTEGIASGDNKIGRFAELE